MTGIFLFLFFLSQVACLLILCFLTLPPPSTGVAFQCGVGVSTRVICREPFWSVPCFSRTPLPPTLSPEGDRCHTSASSFSVDEMLCTEYAAFPPPLPSPSRVASFETPADALPRLPKNFILFTCPDCFSSFSFGLTFRCVPFFPQPPQ